MIKHQDKINPNMKLMNSNSHDTKLTHQPGHIKTYIPHSMYGKITH